MHQIGQTGNVTLEGRTFEVELRPHHSGELYETCERDCPDGWQIPSYFLLQAMRNNLKTRSNFNLLETYEFVINPDEISRKKGFVARFDAGSDRAVLVCGGESLYLHAALGVRYCREILQ